MPRASINLGFEICKIDLLEHVLSHGSLTEAEARPLVRQLASAVEHLHVCDLVHLDIKLENIFLDTNGSVKLGDFGVSAVMKNTRELLHTETGTPYYMAPELYAEQPYQFEADVWSLGVLLYELCALEFPFSPED